MTEKIVLNIGLAAAARGDAEFVAYALGSCVAVCLYDAASRTGGMAHVLLPDSGGRGLPPGERGRYADTAVEELLRLMQSKGADLGRVKAKIYGGAKMFSLGPQAMHCDIGRLNAEAVARQLAKHGVALLEADTGGSSARTVTFDLADGSVAVKGGE